MSKGIKAYVKDIVLPDAPKYYRPRAAVKPKPRAREEKVRPHGWTQEQICTLQEMRTDGCTIAKIAKRIGKSEGAVYGKLRRIREKRDASRNKSAKISNRQSTMRDGPGTETRETR